MLKLYNTLTRQKEVFTPLENSEVRMYSCGPTVYNYAHIGNLRTYIFMDILRRALSLEGFKLKGVMNITDVGHLMSDGDDGEDKMAKAAREQRKSPEEIAKHYTDVFFADIDKLNISHPEIIAKATDHIDDMIDYVKALLTAGYAYETSDGIYFDIAKFPSYGKLSRLNLEEQIAGARVEVNKEKHNPYDFALWKKAEPNHIMQWQSPWGMGYPGWHIECSTMSRKYLGQLFDIHTGGVDHIPVHHENEIAQSEALTDGKKTVNFWMHGEFMLVNNGKMSKSLQNTYTISQLEERGYCAMDFRYFCLNAHYRKKLNFTFEGLTAAKNAYARLQSILQAHKESSVQTAAEVIAEFKTEFLEAMEDDLNIPLALGVLWKMIKLPKSHSVYVAAMEMDKLFGLSLDDTADKKKNDIPQEVADLAQQRLDAKKARDFATADNLRDKIKTLGYIINDTKEGFDIVKA